MESAWRSGPKPSGGLTARMQQQALCQASVLAEEADPPLFRDGRRCPACAAISPAMALSCIVCGAALSGPLDYQIVGTVMPVVEISLQSGQQVYAETSSLGWMTDTVKMQTVVQGSPWAMLGRAVSGMTPLVTQYIAREQAGVVAFTSRVPGQILPVDVSREHEYIMQSGSFLAAQESVTVGPFFNQKIGAILFGGEGFILQKLHGNGTVFVKIDGEVAQYELQAGQVVLVHPGHIALFEDSVAFSIQRVPGISNILFSEGLFLAELKGPGVVWLQTMPFAKLVGAIAARLTETGAGASAAGAGVAGAARVLDSGLGGLFSDGVGSVIQGFSGF